jgi:hypothetical protein
MFRFKTSFMVLALGLTTPINAYAAGFCVAVNGGFDHGGYTYIAPDFTLPAKNHCEAWAGFVKTGATVILNSHGSGCVSNNGAVLDLSIFSTDPDFVGTSPSTVTYNSIKLCLTSCAFTSQDRGSNSSGLGGGIAEKVPCTGLLKLPENHD